MLWIFVSFSGEYFYSVKLPLSFTEIPQGMAVSNYSTKEVSLSLKGQGWQLAQLSLGSQSEFIINVEEKIGEHKILVRNAMDQNRWLSSAVQINEFSPNEIRYRLEEIAEKKVEVVPDLSLNFKDGFGLVADIIVQPDSIVISGPKSLVQGVGFVSTEQKSLNNIDNSETESVSLSTIDNINFSEENVLVTFDVQKIVDKEFQDIPIEIINIPPSKNLTIYPEKVNVILRGGINLLGRLNKEEIKVTIGFDQAIKDSLGYLIPNVIAPEFTKFVDTVPNRLEYIIQQL